MRYLIVTNSFESSEYAKKLIVEIQRFDIRSEFYASSEGRIEKCDESFEFETSYKSIKPHQLKSLEFNLLIIIGDNFDINLLSKAKSVGVRTSFFLLTKDYTAGSRVYKKAVKKFDRIFVDLPLYELHNNGEHIGHYISDIIRKHDFEEQDSTQLRIGFLLSKIRNIDNFLRLVKEVSDSRKESQWFIYSDFDSDILKSRISSHRNIQFSSNKLNLLKNVNVVLVDSEHDSIVAALMNCPQISISGSYGLFGFSKTKTLLVNRITENEIVKNFKPTQVHEIMKELNLLLSDHEYCASVLEAYQDCKSRIGAQPVLRPIAQKIIDWIED